MSYYYNNQSRTQSSFWSVSNNDTDTKTIKHAKSKVNLIVPVQIPIDPNDALNSSSRTLSNINSEFDITCTKEAQCNRIKISDTNDVSLIITFKQSTTCITFKINDNKSFTNDQVTSVTIHFIQFFQKLLKKKNEISSLTQENINTVCKQVADEIQIKKNSQKINKKPATNEHEPELLNISEIQSSQSTANKQLKKSEANNLELILEDLNEDVNEDSSDEESKEHLTHTIQQIPNNTTDGTEVLEKSSYIIPNTPNTQTNWIVIIKRKAHIIIIFLTAIVVILGINDKPNTNINEKKNNQIKENINNLTKESTDALSDIITSGVSL